MHQNVELEQVSPNVYIYLLEKSDDGKPENDIVGVVLRTANVFHETDECRRSSITDPTLLSSLQQRAEQFVEYIQHIMQQGLFLQILHIKVYDELGLDTRPLWDYRQRIAHQKKEIRERQRKEERLRLEDQERKRLKEAKAKLLAGESIVTGDFMALCQQDGVPIPPRTMGTLAKNVIELSNNNIRYFQTGKRAPKLDGCFNVIHAYLKKNASGTSIDSTGASIQNQI